MSRVRRAGWSFADQAISSLTNLALAVVVARSVDETSFGGFAVAFTTFALLIGVNRALTGSVLLIRHSGAASTHQAAAAATATTLSLGIVSSIGCLLVGLFLHGAAGNAIAALGLVLPGLLTQDTWRQVFFAAGKPASATLNDAAWAALQAAAIAALLLSHAATLTTLVLAWGGSAYVATVFGAVQARTLPSFRLVPPWLRDHRDLSMNAFGDFAAQQGASQGTLFAIAAVGSLAAIGAIRGALVLLAVLPAIQMAAANFALPELARRRSQLTARLWLRAAVGFSVAMAIAGLTWGVLLLLLPDSVGRSLLGDTWTGASQVLVPSVVSQVLLVALSGVTLVLRAMDRTRVPFVMNAVQAPLIVLGGVLGVLLGGPSGAIWAFTAVYAAMTPLWWRRLIVELRPTKSSTVASGQEGVTESGADKA
jgi:O-antigen/teichoic acid export membrane protein